MRLVEGTTVANWQLGRLEIFVEGSWGQVCAIGFGAADADVACRQLGFGAGAVSPSGERGMFVAPAEPLRGSDRLVYPDVALVSPGCRGTEQTLLSCRGGPLASEGSASCFGTDRQGRGRSLMRSQGLILACVADAEDSVLSLLHLPLHL